MFNSSLLLISEINRKLEDSSKQSITFSTFECWGISLIEDKGIFLVGGRSNIRININDNYECIQEIKDAHNEYFLFYRIKIRINCIIFLWWNNKNMEFLILLLVDFL